ncbi:cyclin-dependent kinase F-1 [Striga asiatica]|uniref:cyclin-dependent kinase n=1 Tax=Striga asiatica TaxID=4170 RepID=A0A5A7PQJ6_STRAF|nr:cyclin-dependent kinase F-1 [Striga asiatica]
MEQEAPPPSSSKSWSIHTRREITSKYEILERVGSGAYSDVYRAKRRSDSLVVALKEVHDYQSAFREIEALQTLQSCPNVVVLHEYFWADDEDAVLVLEYLPSDLASVIKAAKKEWDGGIGVGEVKRWMVQILAGVDACHRNSIVHRDLKPSNLLISADGVLKVADFGQARILLAPGFVGDDDVYNQMAEQPSPNKATLSQPPEALPTLEGPSIQEHVKRGREKCFLEPNPYFTSDVDEESISRDGAASHLATCTTSDVEDPFHQSYSYEAEDVGASGNGPLTSCVGTRWFRAPELLYGSTSYGLEVDLWSLGCIFAELLSLEPLFAGGADIDQLGKIFSVLGNLTDEVWPGCVQLPDYNIISFSKVENPIGLEACLKNRSPDEVLLVRRLLCFDPASRATAMELLNDKYFNEEPLPVSLSELRVPAKIGNRDEDSSVDWNDRRDFGSDSDFDEFGSSLVTTTENGFSIRFS